jgi:hypothetical protein
VRQLRTYTNLYVQVNASEGPTCSAPSQARAMTIGKYYLNQDVIKIQIFTTQLALSEST